MKEVIHIDREDQKEVEQEERELFVKAVLLELELPGLEDIWVNDQLDTVEQKIALREFLSKYNIDILERDRNVEIYVENELIAIWYKPKYRLMTDLKQINPAKKLFLEMTIESETIFEE